jgi:hypothetical protein
MALIPGIAVHLLIGFVAMIWESQYPDMVPDNMMEVFTVHQRDRGQHGPALKAFRLNRQCPEILLFG